MKDAALNEARYLIAGFLRSRREEIGMTQQELADKMGFDVKTITRIEAGKFWPRLNTLLAMCHHLDCFFFMESTDGKE
jgi:transcriptional regulator with XRE-family HTH domain